MVFVIEAPTFSNPYGLTDMFTAAAGSMSVSCVFVYII